MFEPPFSGGPSGCGATAGIPSPTAGARVAPITTEVTTNVRARREKIHGRMRAAAPDSADKPNAPTTPFGQITPILDLGGPDQMVRRKPGLGGCDRLPWHQAPPRRPPRCPHGSRPARKRDRTKSIMRHGRVAVAGVTRGRPSRARGCHRAQFADQFRGASVRHRGTTARTSWDRSRRGC